MAKLPPTLVKTPNPELRDIEIGQTVFVEASAMRITADDMNCYLLPTFSYQREKNIFYSLRVTRAADGFHVAVLANDRWTADASSNSVRSWIPVASGARPDIALWFHRSR